VSFSIHGYQALALESITKELPALPRRFGKTTKDEGIRHQGNFAGRTRKDRRRACTGNKLSAESCYGAHSGMGAFQALQKKCRNHRRHPLGIEVTFGISRRPTTTSSRVKAVRRFPVNQRSSTGDLQGLQGSQQRNVEGDHCATRRECGDQAGAVANPAGRGFEVYGHEDDDLDIQLRQGFDVRAALFREYAEELYNVEELSFRSDGRDSGSILAEPHISQLITLIGDNKASMDFLGIITDLTILRHELSFLIVIDDPDYCRYPIIGSSEAKRMFSLNMAELKTIFSNQNVHSSSAGLLQLAIESDRLKSLGISSSLETADDGMPG